MHNALKLFILYFVLAVSKSKTKTWIAFKLKVKDEINVQQNTLQELKRSISSYGLSADVDMITLEGKHVFSFIKKTKGRYGVKRQNPIFFQCYINQPYLFCGRQSLDNNIMHAMVSGLGYHSFKKCHLSGTKLLDLLRMLRYKDSKSHDADLLTAEPELSHEIKITPSRTDYSQFSNMKKYAEDIIGVKPPLLQTFKIEIKDAPWCPIDSVEGMDHESMKGVTLTMSSPNILEFIKELIRDGIVTQPVPSYIKGIITSGKNDIKITK